MNIVKIIELSEPRQIDFSSCGSILICLQATKKDDKKLSTISFFDVESFDYIGEFNHFSEGIGDWEDNIIFDVQGFSSNPSVNEIFIYGKLGYSIVSVPDGVISRKIVPIFDGISAACYCKNGEKITFSSYNRIIWIADLVGKSLEYVTYCGDLTQGISFFNNSIVFPLVYCDFESSQIRQVQLDSKWFAYKDIYSSQFKINSMRVGGRYFCVDIMSVLYLYDIESGNCIGSINILNYTENLSSTPVYIDDKIWAVGAKDGSIYIMDFSTSTVLSELKGHSRAVHSMCYSEDKKVLVSSGFDGKIIFWSNS